MLLANKMNFVFYNMGILGKKLNALDSLNPSLRELFLQVPVIACTVGVC